MYQYVSVLTTLLLISRTQNSYWLRK